MIRRNKATAKNHPIIFSIAKTLGILFLLSSKHTPRTRNNLLFWVSKGFSIFVVFVSSGLLKRSIVHFATMSSSGGVSIARTASRGENRFYNPPQIRRLQQEAQLQQAREQDKQRREEERRKETAAERKGFTVVGPPESKNRSASVSEECGSPESSGSGRVAKDGSNLDRFLEHTTPVVMVRCLPKKNTTESRNHDSECNPYFVLEDLWESFAEWSVYGAGVPLLMNGSDSIVQYYVPFLSSIQLYLDPTKPEARPRSMAEDNTRNLNRLSLRDEDGNESNNSLGQLMFEYFEHDPPFGREPLANKISVLASKFPQLMTYRSSDLSPSSWMSVAWYPIYRIPVGPTLQNLDACFLTFHSLSTQSRSTSDAREFNHAGPLIKLPLPSFGLASYKVKVSAWNPNGSQQWQKANLLGQAARDWLMRLRVTHPDYRFFMSHGPRMR